MLVHVGRNEEAEGGLTVGSRRGDERGEGDDGLEHLC